MIYLQGDVRPRAGLILYIRLSERTLEIYWSRIFDVQTSSSIENFWSLMIHDCIDYVPARSEPDFQTKSLSCRKEIYSVYAEYCHNHVLKVYWFILLTFGRHAKVWFVSFGPPCSLRFQAVQDLDYIIHFIQDSQIRTKMNNKHRIDVHQNRIWSHLCIQGFQPSMEVGNYVCSS